ncbi:uncharacterized protein LOC115634739 [Scaptodrosophila lebanonensis]|uniref:Uncharacterized protein LOC115634739 n=1 Tax=Drosophila lebanonensis TaxID=7225 RepID=A0A6J2UMM0_DROLE|nr:uncharacterized protein LOC115634739 [Scaptodrosophila lebanonensis]
MDSCGNDCVLNVTRIIKGNSLDLKNLQKMVKAIIPLDEVYAEILIDAYKLCGMSLPNMRLMSNDANSFSGEPKQDANQNVVTRNGIENEKDDEEDVEPVGCSTLSMMLNSCAIQMTLLTCPPERWNATASSILWLVCFLVPILLVPGQAMSCSQVLDTKSLDLCCGHQEELSENVFRKKGSDCSEYKENYGPCRYECLFREWNLFDEKDHLSQLHLRKMIVDVYKDDYQYGMLLRRSYERCEGLVANYAEFLRMYEAQSHNEGNCSSQAMFIAKCASANIFVHCPEQYWHDSDECNTMRPTLITCISLLNDLENMGADGNPDTRSAAIRQTRQARDASTHWYTAFLNWLPSSCGL